MLQKLALSYGNDGNLEEYQIQQIRERVATANHLPEVRDAWHQLKTNPAYTEQMYWETLISAGTSLFSTFIRVFTAYSFSQIKYGTVQTISA